MNEDSLVSVPPLFAVADGMGGHSAGDIASAAVAARLAEVGVGGAATPELIESALSQAQDDLQSSESTSVLGSGTTVTGVAAVQADGDPAWLTFNIGDSRVYITEQGRLVQRTRDHSMVQEMIAAGLLTPEQAENHPDSNIITRAVGFEDSPVPDYGVIPMADGQRVLVCSDGLTKELSPTELAAIMSRDVSPETLARSLVDAALERGGRDNITVVVITVSEVKD